MARHELDKLTGRHLAIAGEIPHGRPAEGSREWVGDVGEIGFERFQRTLVEAKFGECEVAVIEEHEIADALANQLVDRREGAGDVGLHAAAKADHALGVPVVEADPGAVGAQRRMRRDCRLLDRERRVPAVLFGEMSMEGVQAGRLQPVLAPDGEVPARCASQAVQEFLQVRVAPAVSLEVVLDAVHESVVADPRNQLTHHRCALVVRDAVKVLAHRNGIRDMVCDAMRRDQLVLARGD